MLIPVCAACPGAHVIGDINNDAFPGDVKFTHGLCHFHELDSLVNAHLATEKEIAEHDALRATKRIFLTHLDKEASHVFPRS